MKKIIITLVSLLFASSALFGQANSDTYLNDVRNELNKKWPGNRTINLVYHGHSVPTGYYTGGVVHTFDAYPRLATKLIKEIYPYAVINTITTSIGGEQAINGQKRFVDDVFPMRPDVIFIDYALNDRNSALADVRVAWEMMIDSALAYGHKVILLTPTPDTSEDILSDDAPLAAHAAQIRELATEKNVGLVDSYQIFKDLKASGTDLSSYMAQANHVNKSGHELVAAAIYEWLAPVTSESAFHFDFEEKKKEGADSVVYASDTNINAKLVGADVIQDEERGNVLQLNADADYAQLSATPIDTNDFSISFWYKSNDQRAWRWVMHGEEAEGRHFTCLNYEKWGTDKNFCVYRLTLAGYAGSGQYMQDDAWHHIVFVANSGSGYLFIDGQQKSAADFDLSGFNFTSFRFGNNNGKTTNCLLDDVYFYKTAISLNQVADIYSEQKDKEPQSITSKSSIANPYNIVVSEGQLIIKSTENGNIIGAKYTIYNIKGALVQSGHIDNSISTYSIAQSGAYVLKIQDSSNDEIFTNTFVMP